MEFFDLTEKSSAEQIQSVLNKYVKEGSRHESVILVHATWCGHCKMLLQGKEWSPFTQQVRSKMNVIQLEQQALDKVKSTLNVHSFPTILHMKNGKLHTHEGGRDLMSLLQFVGQQRQQQGGGHSRATHTLKKNNTKKQRKSVSRNTKSQQQQQQQRKRQQRRAPSRRRVQRSRK